MTIGTAYTRAVSPRLAECETHAGRAGRRRPRGARSMPPMNARSRRPASRSNGWARSTTSPTACSSRTLRSCSASTRSSPAPARPRGRARPPRRRLASPAPSPSTASAPAGSTAATCCGSATALCRPLHRAPTKRACARSPTSPRRWAIRWCRSASPAASTSRARRPAPGRTAPGRRSCSTIRTGSRRRISRASSRSPSRPAKLWRQRCSGSATTLLAAADSPRTAEALAARGFEIVDPRHLRDAQGRRGPHLHEPHRRSDRAEPARIMDDLADRAGSAAGRRNGSGPPPPIRAPRCAAPGTRGSADPEEAPAPEPHGEPVRRRGQLEAEAHRPEPLDRQPASSRSTRSKRRWPPKSRVQRSRPSALGEGDVERIGAGRREADDAPISRAKRPRPRSTRPSPAAPASAWMSWRARPSAGSAREAAPPSPARKAAAAARARRFRGRSGEAGKGSARSGRASAATRRCGRRAPACRRTCPRRASPPPASGFRARRRPPRPGSSAARPPRRRAARSRRRVIPERSPPSPRVSRCKRQQPARGAAQRLQPSPSGPASSPATGTASGSRARCRRGRSTAGRPGSIAGSRSWSGTSMSATRRPAEREPRPARIRSRRISCQPWPSSSGRPATAAPAGRHRTGSPPPPRRRRSTGSRR